MMTIQQGICYIFHIIKIYYKVIDLSKETNTNIPQQVNFIGKLEEHDGATPFFSTEKQQKPIINFSLD